MPLGQSKCPYPTLPLRTLEVVSDEICEGRVYSGKGEVVEMGCVAKVEHESATPVTGKKSFFSWASGNEQTRHQDLTRVEDARVPEVRRNLFGCPSRGEQR